LLHCGINCCTAIKNPLHRSGLILYLFSVLLRRCGNYKFYKRRAPCCRACGVTTV